MKSLQTNLQDLGAQNDDLRQQVASLQEAHHLLRQVYLFASLPLTIVPS